MPKLTYPEKLIFVRDRDGQHQVNSSPESIERTIRNRANSSYTQSEILADLRAGKSIKTLYGRYYLPEFVPSSAGV